MGHHARHARSGGAPSAPSIVTLEEAEARLDEEFLKFAAAPPGQLTVLAVTMGAGKTHRAREWLTKAAAPAVVFVPTHALGAEYRDGLEPSLTYVRGGVTGLRIAGQPACKQIILARQQREAGVDPVEHLCTSCPHRVAYDGDAGTACPAYVDATAPATDARVRILQSTRAADHLMGLLSSARATAGSPPIVIFDEPPPLFVTTQATTPLASTARRLLDNLANSMIPALPALGAILEALECDDDLNRATSRALVRRRLGGGADEALEKAASVFGLPSWSPEGQRALASHTNVAATAERAGEIMDLYTTVIEALRRPDRPCVAQEPNDAPWIAARAPWVRMLRSYLRKGGKALVLDATANAVDYKYLFAPPKAADDIDAAPAKPRVVEIHVRDHGDTKRHFHRWGSAAKKHHIDPTGRPRESEIRGPLREVAALLMGAKSAALFALKPLAQALAAEWNRCVADENYDSKLIPAELRAFAQIPDFDMQFSWYGAHRGQNAWKEADAIVTFGDPYPPPGGLMAEALVLDPDEPNFWPRYTRVCHAEKAQAQGRGRPIRRSCRLIDVGSKSLMLGVAPQWAAASNSNGKKGRPRKKASDGSTFAAEWLNADRAARGNISTRSHAKAIGIPESTYRTIVNREKGADSSMPPLAGPLPSKEVPEPELPRRSDAPPPMLPERTVTDISPPEPAPQEVRPQALAPRSETVIVRASRDAWIQGLTAVRAGARHVHPLDGELCVGLSVAGETVSLSGMRDGASYSFSLEAEGSGSGTVYLPVRILRFLRFWGKVVTIAVRRAEPVQETEVSCSDGRKLLLSMKFSPGLFRPQAQRGVSADIEHLPSPWVLAHGLEFGRRFANATCGRSHTKSVGRISVHNHALVYETEKGRTSLTCEAITGAWSIYPKCARDLAAFVRRASSLDMQSDDERTILRDERRRIMEWRSPPMARPFPEHVVAPEHGVVIDAKVLARSLRFLKADLGYAWRWGSFGGSVDGGQFRPFAIGAGSNARGPSVPLKAVFGDPSVLMLRFVDAVALLGDVPDTEDIELRYDSAAGTGVEYMSWSGGATPGGLGTSPSRGGPSFMCRLERSMVLPYPSRRDHMIDIRPELRIT